MPEKGARSGLPGCGGKTKVIRKQRLYISSGGFLHTHTRISLQSGVV